MTRKYREYSDQQIVEAVSASISIAQTLRLLGLKPVGGNYKNLYKLIEKLSINTDHFTGQASNKGREFKTFDGLVTNKSIKQRLINECGHNCQSCNLSKWMGNLIPLELDHIDGDNRNNERSNVRLLCPNCHALTPTYRNRTR